MERKFIDRSEAEKMWPSTAEEKMCELSFKCAKDCPLISIRIPKKYLHQFIETLQKLDSLKFGNLE